MLRIVIFIIMGLINIEKYFHFTRDQITDDEKENLCDDICSLEVSAETDRETTIKLFKITQEILKFKGEQVRAIACDYVLFFSSYKGRINCCPPQFPG